jgi:hypothetical protein
MGPPRRDAALNALPEKVPVMLSRKEDAFTNTHDLIDRVAENKGHGPYKFLRTM